MPIDFPLDQLFVETFRGHPLNDMAWLHYVSGGNRARVNFFLKDNGLRNQIGGQIFEQNTYQSIPQLVKVWQDVVDKFLFMRPPDLFEFVTKLFTYCDWIQDLDLGPLRSISAAESKKFEHFTEPNSRPEGEWMDGLYKEMSRQFRTHFDAARKTKFDNIHDARDFFRKIGTSGQKVFENPNLDSNLVGNFMGFEFGKSDRKWSFNTKAIIPLLLVKISEVVTHFYKESRITELLNSFDKFFYSGATAPIKGGPYDIMFFVAQQSRPNERLGMPQDVLADSSFFINRVYLDTILRSGHAEVKRSLVTLFAMAGHDYTRLMLQALQHYQDKLEKNQTASLQAHLSNLPDTFLKRFQFEPDAKMNRPNLAFIIKFATPKTATGMQVDWKAGEETELPSQRYLSALAKSEERLLETETTTTTIVFEPSLILGAVAVVGAFLLFR